MPADIAICTPVLIVVTCVFSWMGFRKPGFEGKYIFDPERILRDKEYYRLVSSAFLHADTRHLVLNMLTLYLFGSPFERDLGPWQFLIIYFGAILGGSLLSLYIHRHHQYLAYGASGGVCGMVFAYILLFAGARIRMFYLPIAMPAWLYAIGFIVVSFYGMKGHNRGNIGHDAHLGGAIIGFGIAAALNPASVQANLRVFLIVLVSALLLLVYLWLNPLFLPGFAFRTPEFRRKLRRSAVPSHRRETFEMDAILEKISREGYDKLTSEEKAFLTQVSGKYRRRGESEKPESGLAI